MEMPPAFDNMAANVLRELVLQAPPNLPSGSSIATIRELIRAGVFGNKLRHLSTENLRMLFDLFTKSKKRSHLAQFPTKPFVPYYGNTRIAAKRATI